MQSQHWLLHRQRVATEIARSPCIEAPWQTISWTFQMEVSCSEVSHLHQACLPQKSQAFSQKLTLFAKIPHNWCNICSIGAEPTTAMSEASLQFPLQMSLHNKKMCLARECCVLREMKVCWFLSSVISGSTANLNIGTELKAKGQVTHVCRNWAHAHPSPDVGLTPPYVCICTYTYACEKMF